MTTDVVCFGGAHIDCSAYSVGPVVAGASNPVRRQTSVGGVARNVAVRLAGAGIGTALVSRVGSDREARAVLDDLAQRGVDGHGVAQDDERPTAYYTALIDPCGELSVGWADMDVYEALTPGSLETRIADYRNARGWFVDSNLPAETLQWIAAQCPTTTWLAADTISPAKAIRLKQLLARLDYLFCNRLAAATLLDSDSGSGSGSGQPTTAELAAALTARGVGTAIVTDGPRGLALASAGQVRTLPPPVDHVSGDVTGAGDSLVAGTLAGLADGLTIDEAILRGLAAARLTLSKRGA